MPARVFSATCIALSLLAGAAAGQERVFTNLGADQMEQVLRGMGLDFKKSASRNLEGVYFYDFVLGKRINARLYHYKGRDIMIDTLFPEASLESLNRWNATKAKFTRATLHKDAKSAYTALEANLNFTGGITENTVRRFIRDFEEEIGFYDLFVNGRGEPAPSNIGPEGDRVARLTPDMLENIFAKMKVRIRKNNPRTGLYNYDYESAKNYKIRLSNSGNQDLLLDAVFKKMPLETLNKYNFNRKFIRAVLYTQGNVEYTALEANLDCSSGISENMIRHYMITFEEEVQTFIEFINKN